MPDDAKPLAYTWAQQIHAQEEQRFGLAILVVFALALLYINEKR